MKPQLVNMFLIGFVLVTHLAFSQQKVDYEYKLFDYKQGFQQSNVFDIAEGENGFFWLATEKGMVRFDGINFLDFNPPNTSLNQARVNRLYRYKNFLYLIYEKKGCVQFDMNTYIFREVSLLPVADILHTDENTQIILFANGIMEKRVKGKPPMVKKLSSNAKGLLHSWNKQVVVALPGYGLYFYDAQSLAINAKILQWKKYIFQQLESSPNNLYFINGSILYEVSKSLRVRRMFADLYVNKNEVSFFKHVSAKEQIFIKNAKNIVQINKGKEIDLPIKGYKNLQLIVAVQKDSNHLLIGTNQGLLRVSKNDEALTSIDDNFIDGKENWIRVRRKILPYKNDMLLLLGQPFSYTYSPKSRQFFNVTKNSLPIYNGCLVGDDLYAVTEGRGLQKISMSAGVVSDIELAPMNKTETYLSIYHEKSQNKLVVGGYFGDVFEYHLNTGKSAKIKTPFLNGLVKEIIQDTASKNYWFATSEGLFYSNDKWENWHAVNSRFSSALVASILLDNSGKKLWVARDNALELIDLKSNRVIETIENPVLAEDKIFSMLQDKIGRIWLGTFNGITAYDPQTHSFKKLGKKNRLINKEFNYTSAALLPDGNLIFGGLTGYDIIYPKKFNFKKSETNGAITGYHKFNAFDTSFKFLNNPDKPIINFNTDEEFVRLYFSCNDIFKASDFNYEYSLDGARWLKMNNSGYMDITKLRQGEYSLQLRSYDEYGNDIYFKKATLNVMLPFYKTYTFLATMLFAIICLSFLLTMSLKRTSAKENQLKQQIAMDLHDEVGTILTRTLYILGSESTAAAQKFDSQGNNTVAKNIGEALYSLRTYINTINVSFFTLNDLYDEILELLQTQQLPFQYQITTSKDKAYPISSPVFRDTKLSLFEIIANIQKYASASNVTIRLAINDQKLILYVTDDGQLKDISVLHQAKGNGIKNLQKRAQKHHGKVHFWVLNKGSGLCILMYLNLK